MPPFDAPLKSMTKSLAKPRTRILIADDEEPIVDLLQAAMEMANYEVVVAHDGQEALEQVLKNKPDVVLLDVQMPRMTGFEVCERIKSDVLLRHIPVIMLTAQSSTQHKVTGLEHGADDYVTKPFDIDELFARIRTILRRTRLGLEANPLTRLPGNVTIEKEIMARIESGLKFAVLYIDLNSFKAYNDVYGFVKGDEVIRETARVLLSSAVGEDDFVGHIGGDDFVVISGVENFEPLCKKIIQMFDTKAPSFYNEEDRARGYVTTRDRRGTVTQFPMLSMAIGVVTNLYRPITSIGEVSTIGAEMKHYAKENDKTGSVYAVDRRRE
jgi:PleD family two-component response regulator